MADFVVTDERGATTSTITVLDDEDIETIGMWVLPGDLVGQRVGVIAQPRVADIVDSIVANLTNRGATVVVIDVPDRDAAKTLTVAEMCYLKLNELGMTRDDTVVGIGGGSTTDLAGFVAATYLRGIRCVLVPTTMLGAVDAAIGGKTAVNVGGKNLVGVFHHPERVVISAGVMLDLPRDILREGTAEAVKAGFIADPELVVLYETFGLEADVLSVIKRAVAVKTSVVSADFRETGVRGILNFGHTVGHAVETLLGLSHGHAVAVGMVAAARASTVALDFAEEDRVVSLIAALGLPVSVDRDLGRSDVLRQMQLDKKRDRSGFRMALLTRIGECRMASVDDATVHAALSAIGIAN
ncbi:MAG: 3-dehydroquinate synthase [Acidobacteria bacterium]|nr:3-dehydroquinate synthase [Acidobacteriota bacterium]